jgi:hypothetical protein
LLERNGGEGGYLQMLLWGWECHFGLACGWCLEPVSLVLLPWRTSMVDNQPCPPLIGIQQASALVPSGHGQTYQTLLPSWPWLVALWSPSATLLLSAAPQTGRRHSKCLLRIEATSASSCTHLGLSGEHESSSCHGILLETLNWRSCLQSTMSQALLHFKMLPWPNLSFSFALPLRECPTQLLVQSWWRQCA